MLTRRVSIPGVSEEASRLGFGCSSIMGRVGRRASLSALARAFEGGVNYFDVARSYGYGRAEKLVGEFLRGRRDRCVVATKMGIQPSLPSYATGVLWPVLRVVASRVSRMKALSARRGPKLAGVSQGHFDPTSLRGSLEMSLAELGTDYVDLLLLHEVSEAALQNEELLRFLEDVVAGGKARAVGLATSVQGSLDILGETPSIPVVQVASHVGDPCPEELVQQAGFLVTHSAMGLGEAGRLALRDMLKQSPGWMEGLKEAGFRVDDSPEAIPELLLAWALASNPSGITLCGMLKADHVRSNLSTLERSTRCEEDLLALGRALRSAVSDRADTSEPVPD